jgi:hypothetical protein
MATTKKTVEKVKISLFKDNGLYKDDVIVTINGKNWQIKRGVEVEVPAFVAKVLDNAKKQQEVADKYISSMAN